MNHEWIVCWLDGAGDTFFKRFRNESLAKEFYKTQSAFAGFNVWLTITIEH